VTPADLVHSPLRCATTNQFTPSSPCVHRCRVIQPAQGQLKSRKLTMVPEHQPF